jgi:hypothetical protein
VTFTLKRTGVVLLASVTFDVALRTTGRTLSTVIESVVVLFTLPALSVAAKTSWQTPCVQPRAAAVALSSYKLPEATVIPSTVSLPTVTLTSGVASVTFTLTRREVVFKTTLALLAALATPGFVESTVTVRFTEEFTLLAASSA